MPEKAKIIFSILNFLAHESVKFETVKFRGKFTIDDYKLNSNFDQTFKTIYILFITFLSKIDFSNPKFKPAQVHVYSLSSLKLETGIILPCPS